MSATDRRRPSAPRDRFTLLPATLSPHGQGFVAYGMSLQLPADACAEMRQGYADHRDNEIARLCAGVVK